MVKNSLKSQVFALAICADVTNSAIAQETTRNLEIVKAQGSKGVSSGILENPPKWAVTILVRACNAVFRIRYFPAVWKYARVLSKLKPGKGSTLPLFYQQNSVLDTTDK